MQQTENYKLNLIETSDTFSPVPLNENTDKVDATLADHEQRVIKLESCRIIVGVYQRYITSGRQLIELGGRPAAVMVTTHGVVRPYMAFIVGDEVAINGDTAAVNLRIVDNGFEVSDFLTNNDNTYNFMALMGDWDPMYVPKYVAP